MTAKNKTENTIALASGNKGVTDISNVEAAVRGIASMGPMQSTTALISRAEGIRPRRPVTRLTPPSRRMANMASRARPISAM